MTNENPSQGTNSEFLINLKKAFGKYMDIRAGVCFINNVNFALNTNGYANIADLRRFSDADGLPYNTSTAMGMSLYHENRHLGKAAYGLDLEEIGQNLNHINGVNTMQTKNSYDIIIESTNNNPFKGKTDMHVFQLHDIFVKFKGDGVVIVLGKN